MRTVIDVPVTVTRRGVRWECDFCHATVDDDRDDRGVIAWMPNGWVGVEQAMLRRDFCSASCAATYLAEGGPYSAGTYRLRADSDAVSPPSAG